MNNLLVLNVKTNAKKILVMARETLKMAKIRTKIQDVTFNGQEKVFKGKAFNEQTKTETRLLIAKKILRKRLRPRFKTCLLMTVKGSKMVNQGFKMINHLFEKLRLRPEHEF